MELKYIETFNAIKLLRKEQLTASVVIDIIIKNLGSNIMTLESGSILDIDEVDNCLIPIITQLNKMGCKTLYSCGGHSNVYNQLKMIYSISVKNPDNYNEIYQIIQNVDPDHYLNLSYIYIVVEKPSDGKYNYNNFIPMGTDWFLEELADRIVLRCHSAKNFDARSEYLEELFNHLIKLD